MCASGAPRVTSWYTMFCVHVVPDLGYEQMKMSPAATGSVFMFRIVRALVIGSAGIGGSGAATGFETSASKKGGDDAIS